MHFQSLPFLSAFAMTALALATKRGEDKAEHKDIYYNDTTSGATVHDLNVEASYVYHTLPPSPNNHHQQRRS